MISGFLDTNGVLYPCPSYAHMSLAEELVEKFNMEKVKGCPIPEDVLLINGWICIRASDVYKNVWGVVKWKQYADLFRPAVCLKIFRLSHQRDK